MLNHIVVMGRLTRDPELRYTKKDVPVASFTIACERDRTSQDSEKETDFIDIVTWGKTAEYVSKYFTKGRMAVVHGRLQIRSYTDKNDNLRKVAEINADNVYFGDSKKDDGSKQAYRDTESSSSSLGEYSELDGSDDDELPF
ncbi:MAG: ssb [Eubacterium sp.]|nr:ssb [Eubacterium sp.]